MSGLRRGRGRKNISLRGRGDTNNEGTPSTPQSLEEMPANSAPTQASSAGSSNPIKKGRGVYKYCKVDSRTRFGSKIRVLLSDDMTRAVGGEARNLVNYCGYVVRTTISFQHGAEWKNIYEVYKDEMILKVKDKFEPSDATEEEKFKETITMNFQNAFRNWKTKLHSHYNKYASDEERRANPPQTISFEDWELLLAYFQTDTFTKKSKTNKGNRGKQVTKHTCGSRSFEEVKFATRDPTTGQAKPPAQLHMIQHTRKNAEGQLEWVDPQSQQIHANLEDLCQQQEDVEVDSRMTSDEILRAVRGERSGYVRGKGYGAEPLRKRNRSQTSDNSAVEIVRTQLFEEFDKKFEEQREKMEAERARLEAERVEERARLEAERARLEAERVEERARMEAERAKERAQFDEKIKQMEERILSILMPQGQVTAPTLSTPSLPVPSADRSS